MKRLERKWMYERLNDRKKIRLEFAIGVNKFIDNAKQQEEYILTKELRCPCLNCKNKKYLMVPVVKEHLCRLGFCPNYYKWTYHGEDDSDNQWDCNEPNISSYRSMVLDALGPDMLDNLEDPYMEEEECPNPQAKSFFEMLEAAEKPVHEGNKMTLLEVTCRIINLKCEHNLSHKCIDAFISLIDDLFGKDNIMTRTFYDTRKVLKGLELPHQKIHACYNGCMLFWKDDTQLDKCKKCGHVRYKKTSRNKKQIPVKVLTYFPIAPRLQRLYATRNIAGEMRWHSENPRVSGTMAHPSDSEAWKFFDDAYPEFAREPRNVRLGLSTDGFSPFGQFGKSYSCWPVILTPYNLPPWLSMKKQFMFLSLIIPGPKNPKRNLDVFLQPLVDELKQLWEVVVLTYDVSKKQNFQLKASLLWTISDFPAYGMLSGWSTTGHLACPYCMEETTSFHLPHGRKECWFDCHRRFLPSDHVFRKNKSAFYKGRVEDNTPPPRLSGNEVWEQVSNFPDVISGSDAELKKLKAKKKGWFKQSIFWQLPYWETLLIRHNLDVMHIEKNFFEQLIHTVMDVKNKTCDTPNTRKDVPLFCNRRNLHIRKNGQVPKAPFTLDKDQKRVLCEWLSNLKFPDSYASDLGRCVDLQGLRLSGLKSHDFHVFMERLLPVALKRMLPTNVWNAITEISQYFRDLCASTVKFDEMERLENNIAEILCKLEKIFPPSFFNSMEHLPVHLAYEAKVGGPVQYRWMYPFERFLNHLKRKIGNKSRVEGSICNAYLMEEISNFCSQYFGDNVDTKAKDLDIGVIEHSDPNVPILFQPIKGRTTSHGQKRYLDDKEYDRAHLYVLSNCQILRDYEKMFEEFIIQQHPHVSLNEIWSTYEEQFPEWFKHQVLTSNIEDDLLQALAMGPSVSVMTWKQFYLNGFNFQTYSYGKNKSTMNYGVCVGSLDGMEYYGILDEIIELSYVGSHQAYKTVLFKCSWMDNSLNGMNVHEQYKLVEVNHTKKYPKYDPFVLGYQAQQVYFAHYPSTKNDRNQWWAVFKTKPRSKFYALVLVETVFQEEIVHDPPTLSMVNENEERDLDNEEVENEQGSDREGEEVQDDNE